MADACQGDAVITMLADDGAIEDVVFGETGMLQSLGKRTTHVSMSTISIALCERLADVHATAGQRFVAAPVFGRPDVAAHPLSRRAPPLDRRRLGPRAGAGAGRGADHPAPDRLDALVWAIASLALQPRSGPRIRVL